MQKNEQPEVWLRGPLPNIPALLQPAAHALLQAEEELTNLGADFPNEFLWEKPADAASVGFHLQHLAGVLDRLFTYAREEQLSDSQLDYLRNEGKEPFADCTFQHLLERFSNQIKEALNQLQYTEEHSLTQIRHVGRANIPSTLLGLLFHAAEHTQRHVGQLLVTARILKAGLK